MAFDWKKTGAEWAKAAGKFAAMTLVVPAMVSYFVSNRVDQNSKIREAQSAQIAKFATGNDSIFVSATDFIASIAPNNLTPSHDKLRRDLVQQIQSTDSLLLYFKDPIIDKQIISYKEILDQSVTALDGATDAIKLVKWANTLSRMNDARVDLVRDLLTKSQTSS